MTSEDLLEVLHDQWKIAGEGKEIIVDEPTETSLVNVRGTKYRLVRADAMTETSLTDVQGGGSRRFGPCWICGGNHYRRDCPKRHDVKCQHPGCTRSHGHVTKDCWEKPENAAKRPSWFIPATSQESGTVEILV